MAVMRLNLHLDDKIVVRARDLVEWMQTQRSIPPKVYRADVLRHALELGLRQMEKQRDAD